MGGGGAGKFWECSRGGTKFVEVVLTLSLGGGGFAQKFCSPPSL